MDTMSQLLATTLATMTPTETAAILRQFNEWRRGDDETVEQPDPREIGEAIDAAVEMIDRLEAAEKSDAESIAMYRKARDERDALRAENETLAANLRGKHSTAGATYAHLIAERDALRAAVRHEADCVEACKSEIDALRAKITEMEQQEPFDADSDVFRSAFEAALKAGYWPAARQGDGYRSPSTQIAWRIAFSTVNRLKLYLAPGAKGE